MPDWPWACAAALGMAVAVVVCPAALAGTASVAIDADAATLVYRAAPGERNYLGLERDVPSGGYRVSEQQYRGAPVAVAAGPGCAPSTLQSVLCELPPGRPQKARIALGDRRDVVSFGDVGQLAVDVDGGAGPDFLTAPSAHVPTSEQAWEFFALWGSEPRLVPAGILDSSGAPAAPRSTLSGGPGSDELWGGAGADVLVPGDGRDVVKGAGGDDRVAARNGSLDFVECDDGRDRVAVDRFDFVWNRCGSVSRRPGAAAYPINARSDDPHEGPLVGQGPLIVIAVGCPSDGPRVCNGEASIRGGEVVVRRQFHVPRGGVRQFLQFPRFDFKYRARSRLIVHSRDAEGREWAIARLFNLELPRDNPD